MNNRKLWTGIGAAAVVAIVVVVVVWVTGSSPDDLTSTAPIMVEHDQRGDPVPAEEQTSIGSTELKRDSDGLEASVQVEGLTPGGVYTFWMAVVQGEGVFPDDIFAIEGPGVVVGEDGKAEASLSARSGDSGFEGFYVEYTGEGSRDGTGDIFFDSLHDPEGSLVRIEIAYHGQVDDAGDDLDLWMSDFFSGADGVCPNPRGTLGTGAISGQAYCPVYFASVHVAPGSEDAEG